MDSRNKLNTEKVIVTVEDIKKLHEFTNSVIEKQNITTWTSVKKHRKMTPQLKERDKVYLLTKNLKTKKPSKKLNHVKVKLFLIKVSRKLLNYFLDLSKDIKVHSVFHILLLKLADLKTLLQTVFWFISEEENKYKVEQILQQKGQQYLVKQKGYSELKNTWEPKVNLINCQKLLQKFH